MSMSTTDLTANTQRNFILVERCNATRQSYSMINVMVDIDKTHMLLRANAKVWT